MLRELRKERVGILGGLTGGCRCEGQDATEWGQVAPYLSQERAAGGVRGATGERTEPLRSSVEPWSPGRLLWGAVMSSTGPAVRFISLAHA